MLLGVVVLTRGQLPRGRPLALAAISGLLMVTLTYEGIAEGTKLAGAGNAAVLVNTTPFFVLVFGRVFLGERIAGIGRRRARHGVRRRRHDDLLADRR